MLVAVMARMMNSDRTIAQDAPRDSLARELVDAMQTIPQIQHSLYGFAEIGDTNSSQAQALRTGVRQFAEKYLSREALMPRLAGIYARGFSTEELRALIRFYQSPAGAHLAREQPELQKISAEVYRQIRMEHEAEFRALTKRP
jgi:hypothetical protein